MPAYTIYDLATGCVLRSGTAHEPEQQVKAGEGLLIGQQLLDTCYDVNPATGTPVEVAPEVQAEREQGFHASEVGG